MIDVPETMREAVARAICWKNGMNPDLTLGGDGQNFLWMEYMGQADAAIEAVLENLWQLPSIKKPGTEPRP